MSDLSISAIEPTDTAALDTIIEAVSVAQVYPLLSDEGVATLRSGREQRWQQLQNDADNGHLKAVVDGQLAGFIRWRDGHFIYALYVDLAFQGHGIGRRLLEAMVAACGAEEIRLRSSLNAVDFYRHCGFVATGEAAEFNGIRFVPMSYRPPR